MFDETSLSVVAVDYRQCCSILILINGNYKTLTGSTQFVRNLSCPGVSIDIVILNYCLILKYFQTKCNLKSCLFQFFMTADFGSLKVNTVQLFHGFFGTKLHRQLKLAIFSLDVIVSKEFISKSSCNFFCTSFAPESQRAGCFHK